MAGGRRWMRVVAGDRVRVARGQVSLNGAPLSEPYLEEAPGGQTWDFAEIIIPDGQVFILGDNRAGALDSRSFGPLPEAAVIGRVVWQY